VKVNTRVSSMQRGCGEKKGGGGVRGVCQGKMGGGRWVGEKGLGMNEWYYALAKPLGVCCEGCWVWQLGDT